MTTPSTPKPMPLWLICLIAAFAVMAVSALGALEDACGSATTHEQAARRPQT